MAELPSGTVTFLFTDLEGSTRLWEEHPDGDAAGAWRVTTRSSVSAVAAHGGHVVKTTGDGVHAVFATAHDAVDAAVRCAAGRRSTRPLGSDRAVAGADGAAHRARPSFATATTSARAVNRAARLMAAAHGGQIVVSHATEELVRDALGRRSSWSISVSTGCATWRGRSGSFQVRARRACRDDFPPLRSLDAFPGNLPLQLTSFVGRDDELARDREGARRRAAGDVDRRGRGRQDASRAAGRRGSAAAVPRRRVVLRARGGDGCRHDAPGGGRDLGVCKPRQGVSLEESIVDALRPKRRACSCSTTASTCCVPSPVSRPTILRACPDVRLLATSREGLGVAGEQIWPLASLTLPESSELDRGQ